MIQATFMVVHCLARCKFLPKEFFVFHTWYVFIGPFLYNCTIAHLHSMIFIMKEMVMTKEREMLGSTIKSNIAQ